MLRGFGLSVGEVQAVGRTLAGGLNLQPKSTGGSQLSEILDVEATVFEVANAITATAQKKDSVAARLQMEEVGHRYLMRRAA